MKTASFFSYFGPGKISIARRAPRGFADFRLYRELAPGPWFNSVSYEAYLTLFNKQLAELDPQQTFDALVALVAPAEPVLLCWERPPLSPENWCHRRMVAAWFERTLSVAVPELGGPQAGLL